MRREALAVLAVLALCSPLPAGAAEAGDAWLTAGNRYAAAQQYAEALAAYQQAARLNPGASPAWYGVGWSYYHLEKYRQAVDPLREALRLDPTNRDAGSTLGESYLELGNYPAAEAAFRDLLRTGEDYPATLGLARALSYQKRYAEALPSAERSVTLRADQPRPRVVLARLYRHLNRTAEAEAALSAAYALDPSFEPTLREQLSLYLASKQPGPAQTSLYALLVRYPRDPALLEAQVTFCQLAGLTDRLPLALAQLIAVLPPVPAAPYRRELGTLYLAQHRYPEAEVQLRAALAAQPADSAGAVLLAQAMLAEGRPQDAADLLAALSRRQAPQAEVLAALAQAQMAAGQAAAALPTAERALRLEAGSEVALTVAEAAARALNRREAQLGYLRRLLAMHPGEGALRLRLAETLEATGRTAEALAQYQLLRSAAGSLAPVAASRLLALAMATGNREWELQLERQAAPNGPELIQALLEQSRLQEADEVLSKALRRQPDNPDLLALRAEELRRSGRTAEAGQLLEAALARHSQHAGLNREAARHWCAQGQPDQAAGLLRQALRADPLAAATYAALVECASKSSEFPATAEFLWRLAEPPTGGTPQAEGMALDCLAKLWEAQAGAATSARELRRLSDSRPDRAELAWRAAEQSGRAHEYTPAAEYYQRAAQDPAYTARALRLAVMARAQAGNAGQLIKTAADYLSRVAQDPRALALTAEMGAGPAPAAPELAVLVGLAGAAPDSLAYHRYRLALFLQRGRLAEARAEYAARAAEQDTPAAWLALALAQDLSQEPREALATLERQPAEALADPQVMALHAQLLRDQGQTERALAVLEPAIGGRDPELSRLRAELLQTARRPREALAEYARALTLGADPQVCLQRMGELWTAHAVTLEELLGALGPAYAALLDPAPVRQWVAAKLPAEDPQVQVWREGHGGGGPQLVGG